MRNRKSRVTYAVTVLTALLPPMPAIGQQARVGETARSAVGQVGQRQTRAEAAPNTEPLARIDNRINNRVQSRIRNRIDRNYGPQTDTLSPFEVAGEQVRVAGDASRR